MSSDSTKSVQWLESARGTVSKVLGDQRLFSLLFKILAVCVILLLLVFFLQPTNVVVDNSRQLTYLAVFGSIGFIFGLYFALYLVTPQEDLSEMSSVGKVFHYIGVWGTRGCIIFIIYMLFAIGGYLLPKHQAHWAGGKAFEEEVVLAEYRLAASSLRLKRRGFIWFNNEFLVVEKTDKKTGKTTKLVLLIDNIIGSNKLNYESVAWYLTNDSGFDYPRLYYNKPTVKLIGRKNKSGITYDALKLIKK